MGSGRIITRADGAKFHLGGRNRPKTPHLFKLHDPKYGLNLSAWPTPSSTSYGAASAAQPVLTDILMNDQLGCCTTANSFHLQALRQAAAGANVFHPASTDVLAIYGRDGGYVPGQPDTDQGADETVVMSNAQNLGIPCGPGSTDVDKIVAYMVLDATNRPLVRAAVSAFVGATVCMELPDACVNPFPSGPGWTWSVPDGGYVAVPSNGHCYTLLDQADDKVTIGSWGMEGYATYDFLAAGSVDGTGGALYIELDIEVLNAASKQAPDALDWDCLKADFLSIPAGVIEPPAP